MLILSLLLIAASDPPPKTSQPTVAASPAQPDVAATFQTSKTLPEVEECLTAKLSEFGEVTAVPIEGMKTLMFRTTDEPPMMIDIAPPTVTVTTKFAVWTRPIIQTCL
jgi:hypothetical protein